MHTTCVCVCVCRELPRVNSFWPEQQHSLRPTSQSFQSISSCDLRVSRVCSHRVHITRTYELLPWLLWLLAAPGRMRTIQVRRMLGCPRLRSTWSYNWIIGRSLFPLPY